MDIIIAIILSLAVGVTISHILTVKAYSKPPIGTLRVDSSDPDGPYLFLDLETDPSIITKEKTVLLKVDTRSYISQK